MNKLTPQQPHFEHLFFSREMMKLESSVGRLAEIAIYSEHWYIQDKTDITCKIKETEERIQKLVNTYLQEMVKKIKITGRRCLNG